MTDSQRLLTRRQNGVSLNSVIRCSFCCSALPCYRPAAFFTYSAICEPVANHTPGFDFM